MSEQTIDVTLGWHQQDAALDYAKDLERRGWSVILLPKLQGSDWRWQVTAHRALPTTKEPDER